MVFSFFCIIMVGYNNLVYNYELDLGAKWNDATLGETEV